MQQTSRPVIRRFAVAAMILAACAGSLGAGQDSRSAATARELVQILDQGKLDALAVADPATPDSFVAALYLPETQLLVVSAKYSAPSLLIDKIKAGDYRGVYMDLHAAGMPGTRIFVQDIGPDGLLSKSDNGDSWEEAGRTTVFDGQWKKTKLNEAEYEKLFGEADERYAQMLALLAAQGRQMKGKIGS